MKIAKILFEGKTCYGKLENGMAYPISGDLFGSFTVGSVGIPLEKAKLLAPADPSNDGRQTPMRGHPCFIAQHATGCCCRGCLQKWHHIAAGRPLTQDQINHIIFTLMSWIREHSAGAEHVPHTPDLF